MTEDIKRVPPHIQQAAGELALWFLAQGMPVDQGCFLELADVSVGPKPCDTPMGNWRIEVRRTALPAPFTKETDHGEE